MFSPDEIWVLGETRPEGELAPTTFELTGAARELADSLSKVTGNTHNVRVLFLNDSKTARAARPEEVACYGANAVATVARDGLPFDRAACARILAHIAERGKPQIVLAAATAFGRSVMPYTAALLQTGLTADCTGLAIDSESGLLLQTRPAIGGNIIATIKTPRHRPQMATVRPKTFQIPEKKASCPIEISKPELPPDILNPTVRTLAFKNFKDDDGTLQERDIIVSGGKGLRRAEGFALIAKLAALLNAGVGASRPTVEMKWIGYPHQVGLSGQTVSPKVYIAAGISGSVQHLAGMQTAGKIISINRDPEAQIFGISDVAICGDLYEVIPRLIEKIEAQRKELAR